MTGVLTEFASAFNSGDAATVRTTFSPDLWAFSMPSTLRGRSDTAYGLEDAVRYVLERQSAGDRLEFVRAQVNELAGWDGAAQIGPLAFVLRRGGSAFALQGKAAVYCAGPSKGIKVLALANEP